MDDSRLPMLAPPNRLRELLLPTVEVAKEKLNLPCPVDLRHVGEGLALVIDAKEYPIMHGSARINLEDPDQVDTFRQTFGAYVENAMQEHLDEGGVSPCRPRLTRRAMAIIADIEARNERDAKI
jgi:hypothetical protein